MWKFIKRLLGKKEDPYAWIEKDPWRLKHKKEIDAFNEASWKETAQFLLYYFDKNINTHCDKSFEDGTDLI